MSDAREARLTVHVVPRAGRDAIDGVVDGQLRVRVAAAPADGAANAAVIRVVAASLGVPPTSVRVVRGATARRKVLGILDLDPTALRARWPGLGS